jgi:hypothetical protein
MYANLCRRPRTRQANTENAVGEGLTGENVNKLVTGEGPINVVTQGIGEGQVTPVPVVIGEGRVTPVSVIPGEGRVLETTTTTTPQPITTTVDMCAAAAGQYNDLCVNRQPGVRVADDIDALCRNYVLMCHPVQQTTTTASYGQPATVAYTQAPAYGQAIGQSGIVNTNPTAWPPSPATATPNTFGTNGTPTTNTFGATDAPSTQLTTEPTTQPLTTILTTLTTNTISNPTTTALPLSTSQASGRAVRAILDCSTAAACTSVCDNPRLQSMYIDNCWTSPPTTGGRTLFCDIYTSKCLQ